MWQLLTPFRKRVETRHAPAVPGGIGRTARPSRIAASCRSPCRAANHPSPWSDRPSSGRRRPAATGQHPSTSSASDRPAVPSQVVRDFSPSNSFTWDPMQEGSYDIQVTVKDSFGAATGESATASYTADSRVVGIRRGGQPHVQPPGRPVQRAPSSGSSMYVEFSPLGSDPSWQFDRPAAHRAGGEHQLPRGGHAARHDVPHEARPERWDDLRPLDVHDREPCRRT